MTVSIPTAAAADSVWVRFWHAPVRAERLALMRLLLATGLLGDQLLQYLPHIAEFFSDEGVAPPGLHDAWQLQTWRLTAFFFTTGRLSILYPVFWLWVGVNLCFLLGWKTRWMNLGVLLLTRCFIERNPMILTSGDDVLQVALFLMLLAPSGQAFSIDAWQKRRRGLLGSPAWVPPWSLRLVQIQLCLIYCSTGLVKLKGDTFGEGPVTNWLTGTWWDGTSLHYFLNDSVMWRRSFAEYPIPFWITMPMTYFTVWWEVLFPVLVLWRRTRWVTLIIGVSFHLGIFLTGEVGWFGFYTLALYSVWLPDSFWRRMDRLLFDNPLKAHRHKDVVAD